MYLYFNALAMQPFIYRDAEFLGHYLSQVMYFGMDANIIPKKLKFVVTILWVRFVQSHLVQGRIQF